MSERTKQRGGLVILVMLSVITLIGFVKSIFVSLDIDESYAIAQAYRLATGDHMLADMWEPHQFSAVPIVWFIKLYLILFRSVDHLVIVLRIFGVLLHTGVGLLLLRTLRKINVSQVPAYAVFFIHLNFLPKWVQMPEFELIHYWMILLIAICMMEYFLLERKKWILPFAAGVCLVVAMLCYPTMILLYPGYLIGWIVMERKLKGAIGMTLGSLLSGSAFLIYLCSYQSPAQLTENVSYIFMDKSHTTYTMAQKWQLYGEQMSDQLGSGGKYFLLAILCACICVRIFIIIRSRFAGKQSGQNDIGEKNRILGMKLETFLVTTFLITAILFNFKAVIGFVLQDKNQFFLQVRYVVLIVPTIYLAIRHHKKLAIWLYGWLIPAVLSLIAVLMITNMDTNTSYAKMFPGVLGSLLLLWSYYNDKQSIRENPKAEVRLKKFNKKAAIVFLQSALYTSLFLALLVCRLLMIRVTGCMPVTVKAPLIKMTAGAEKGVYVLAEQGTIWNENNALIQSKVKKDDKVLYIGAENLAYLTAGAELATPSTQGTNVYDEMFLRYFELHPDKKPTVIIFDKTYETNAVYGNYFGWEPVREWIEENYTDADVTESEYLIIWTKRM